MDKRPSDEGTPSEPSSRSSPRIRSASLSPVSLRSELAEARQQQQRRYERDLSHFKAKEEERERERRERWLARHRTLGSPAPGSASRLGHRLNGNPRCGGAAPAPPPGHHPLATPSRGPSASPSFSSSSAFSTSSKNSGSRGSRRLRRALVPWGPDAPRPKVPDAEATATPRGRGRDGAEGVVGAEGRQCRQGPPPAGPDITAIRLAHTLRQENMEYERRRQRLSRFRENAASLRRRIPKNDPGHRLGGGLGEPTADAGLGASMGSAGQRFHSVRARAAPVTQAARAARAAPREAEPTITLPDDGDDPDHLHANRGEPYVLSQQASPTAVPAKPAAPCYPPRFSTLPRAARSPTVARNTPAASTTSTPKVSPPPPPPTAQGRARVFTTFRPFGAPRAATPAHNCGLEHPDHPHAAPRPHRQAHGMAHGPHRTARMAYAIRRGTAASACSAEKAVDTLSRPAKASRVAPSNPAIEIGSGVILPNVQLATIVVVPRGAIPVARAPPPPPKPVHGDPQVAPERAVPTPAADARADARPAGPLAGPAAPHRHPLRAAATPKAAVPVRPSPFRPARPALSAKRKAPPLPRPAGPPKVQRTMGRPWR